MLTALIKALREYKYCSKNIQTQTTFLLSVKQFDLSQTHRYLGTVKRPVTVLIETWGEPLPKIVTVAKFTQLTGKNDSFKKSN